MPSFNEPQQQPEKINEPLHLIVIGAGLAGLAAAITTRLEGHKVTLLEKVAQLQEVGAGLQVTPNATRLLKHWGIFDELEPKAAKPHELSVLRYDGTRLLARTSDFQKSIDERYGNPFWDLHRADLQKAMSSKALELGVDLKLSAEVVSVDLDRAVATLKDGQRFQGDVILAADGLWSPTRSQFLGYTELPKPTGDLAYRIILDLDEVDDPELRSWISNPTCNFWIGPRSHVVGYSVKAGTQFNLVLLVPDDLAENVSRAQGNIDEMKELFRDWDPILRKFLEHVKSVDKWRLMHLTELASWRNEAGTFVMAGDSCHPMLPYLAQGANSSLEDGAVLGRLLGHIKSPEQISEVTRLYQLLRKDRGETVVRETFKQRSAFHMEDGVSQERRDDIFLEALATEPTPHFPSRWTCPVVQRWLYGYDAIQEADKAWTSREVKL